MSTLVSTNKAPSSDQVPPRPLLTKVGTDAIHHFVNASKLYLEKVDGAALKDLVQHELLQALVSTNIFPGICFVCDITDEHIRKWLYDSIASTAAMHGQKQMVDQLSRHVQINMSEENVDLRIISLFADYQRFINRIGWTDFVHETPRQAARHIYMLLKPQKLKRSIAKLVESRSFTGDGERQWARFIIDVRRIAVQQDMQQFFFKRLENEETE